MAVGGRCRQLAVGLGELGRKEGYIARQLKRWYSQFQSSNELTKRPIPIIHEVHDRLAARIPDQGAAAIVHGDYRLDNCMVDDSGEVIAVLDCRTPPTSVAVRWMSVALSVKRLERAL